MRYSYAVDDVVLDVFASLPARQREQLIRIFDQLGDNPFLAGDTTQLDADGRPCEVKRFGEWTVIYWSEHIATKVHILSIEHLKLS